MPDRSRHLEILAPDAVHRTTGYSQAVRVGDLVFVAGQAGQDRTGAVIGIGDVRAQTRQAYANLAAVLEAAGSGLDLIVKTTVYTTSRDLRPAIAEVRDTVFAPVGHYPASTFVVVLGLALPEMLVEIDAIAVVRR